jgi:G:T-mismatch repair DNA endonuclease (very short patch repair protein)
LPLGPRHPEDAGRVLGSEASENEERDEQNIRALNAAGWKVVII